MIHAIHAEIYIGKESNSVSSQISPFADSVEAETINSVNVETIHASALYLALLMLIILPTITIMVSSLNQNLYR